MNTNTEIKRFDLENEERLGGWSSENVMNERNGGDWVRYEDHAAEIARLQAALAEREAKQVQPTQSDTRNNAEQIAFELIAARGGFPHIADYVPLEEVYEFANALAQRVGCGEPVARMTSDNKMLVFADRVSGNSHGMQPLYTTPPAAVTDADKRDAARLRKVSTASFELAASLCRIPTMDGAETLIRREDVMHCVSSWRRSVDAASEQANKREGAAK